MMGTAVGSYLAIDPGRNCGWASCLRGGAELRYGTWKFKQDDPGECYSSFLGNIRIKLEQLPDCQIGIELMTIVVHEDAKGKPHIDAEQVMFSSGWPTHAQTLCWRMRKRPPELIAIGSWRSRTHGKVRAPNGMKQSDRTKFFKEAAFGFCRSNGWTPDTDNAAEALCILSYLRVLHEPEFAFAHGHAHHQEALAL